MDSVIRRKEDEDGVLAAPDRGTAPPAQSEPLPMMAAYIPMMTAGALAAAGRLGVFKALADGPLDVQSLAEAAGSSAAGMERLTDFLVASGHLRRHGRMIANTSEMIRWFTHRGIVDYSAGLDWTADAWSVMDDLSDAVRQGGPKQLLWDRMAERPELGDRFSRYMHAFAKHLAPDLVDLSELPARPLRLLDLGGSHGTHSMAFCRRFPELQAVIVDLETALADTSARITYEGFADRISVRNGDIRECDWGEGYDLALYLSVAHNMSIDENRRIFRRLGSVLRPGGVLIIHDYPRETTPALFEAAFRLTLLVETGTQTLTCVEFSDLLEDAGFSSNSLHVLSPAEKGSLIVARR
ncbi:class I SAM-dependent methyltransferase [Sphingobium sp. PNB]|uniref:SAM-dependent methyltransferase n=1 Tax=Sphingobium sp. PNB TaxID=863934 RepID=UPI001CA468A8|nr:class I SAM-dependent methyltransferase [Sphingobium sp. PNB]MCB4859653.1 class I SAM-dependent methyltransferase [Sphingobium sp. PNB]